MTMISDQDRKTLQARFRKDVKRDVDLTLYTVRSIGGLIIPGRECASCRQTEQLMSEVAAASPRLRLTVRDLYADADEARQHGVERAPCITLRPAGDDAPGRLRFYGMPSGYEFATFIEDIVTVAKGVSPLLLPTRKALRRLEQPAHLQVFVTPT